MRTEYINEDGYNVIRDETETSIHESIINPEPVVKFRSELNILEDILLELKKLNQK